MQDSNFNPTLSLSPPPTTKKHRTPKPKIIRPDRPKKPDPNAPKITRPCTECGKKFWSWKALFGHMRCHPERQWRGINPPPHLNRGGADVAGPSTVVVTEEERDVAACLLMLARGNEKTMMVTEIENADVAHGFKCTCCKKTFGSHQALGGHRASHKNVKGCFAINSNFEGEFHEVAVGPADDMAAAVAAGHTCGVCRRVFSSGQALGGHKRCHWEGGPPPSTLALGPGSGPSGLDLNSPAQLEDDSSSSLVKKADVELDLRLGL